MYITQFKYLFLIVTVVCVFTIVTVILFRLDEFKVYIFKVYSDIILNAINP